MKKIKTGKDEYMEIFDEKDLLCPTCSYPLDLLDYPNNCLSCNITKKIAREAHKDSFLKTIYPYPFKKIICVGEYHMWKRYSKNSKNPKYKLSGYILHYKNNPNNIGPFSGLLKDLIKNLILKININKKDIIICGVPDLTSKRHQKADLLCKEISKKTGINYFPLLKKIREIDPQHKIKGIEKKYENVHGAYILDESYKKRISKKIIFLIDDIITTMASVNECARKLKEYGCKDIYVLGLGRSIFPPSEEEKK